MTTCSLPPCAATGSRWSPSSLSPSCHGGEFICLVSGAWRLCHPGLFHRTCMLPHPRACTKPTCRLAAARCPLLQGACGGAACGLCGGREPDG